MSWVVPAPRWNTVAGRVLDGFLEDVHRALPNYQQPVTVIGSAAIQLCLDEAFASADVDVMVLSDAEQLREIASLCGIGRTGSIRSAYGVQICPPQLFKTTPHYLQRAQSEFRHGIRIIIPHVRDILIAKLHRFRAEGQEGLVPKDSRAFVRVRELCGGHPSAEDLIEDLIHCEPEFRVPADGGINFFRLNVLDLFATHYGRHLDVANEIATPAKLIEQSVIPPPGAVKEMLSRLMPERE
jgi:hypothetical protein